MWSINCKGSENLFSKIQQLRTEILAKLKIKEFDKNIQGLINEWVQNGTIFFMLFLLMPDHFWAIT